MASRFAELLQVLKQLIMQVQTEEGNKPWLGEFKTILGKLESASSGGSGQEGGADSLLFPKSETLGNALRTIEELERTGALIIKGSSPAQEGSIEFLLGKITSAASGRVRGTKAIYRMFTWPEVRYVFTRRDAAHSNMDEPVHENMTVLCRQGEEFAERMSALKGKIPPPQIKLELEPANFNEQSRMIPEDFMVLSDMIAFSQVSSILDYSAVPDVVIFEALIRLRKQNLIRVAA